MKRFVLGIVTCVTLFALIWPAGSLAAGPRPGQTHVGQGCWRLRSLGLSAA